MQYAYHICNGIDPTVISISMFGHFTCPTKILGRAVLMIFATALSIAVLRYAGVGISTNYSENIVEITGGKSTARGGARTHDPQNTSQVL